MSVSVKSNRSSFILVGRKENNDFAISNLFSLPSIFSSLSLVRGWVDTMTGNPYSSEIESSNKLRSPFHGNVSLTFI